MYVLKTLLISSLLVGLAGCHAMRSGIHPEAKLSARRQGFVSKAKPELIPSSFTRILVVLKQQQPDERYARELMRTFPGGYQVCTMSLNPYQPAGQAELIHQQATDCQSEVVLTIERTHRGKFVSLDAPDGDDFSQYTFEMRSVASQQVFWKGISATGRLAGTSFSARALVTRLRNDSIITGEIPDRALVLQSRY